MKMHVYPLLFLLVCSSAHGMKRAAQQDRSCAMVEMYDDAQDMRRTVHDKMCNNVQAAMDRLLAPGESPSDAMNMIGFSLARPLDRGITEGFLCEATKILIKRGAALSESIKYGKPQSTCPALISCAQHNYPKLTQIFIDAGADIRVQDPDTGRTPLICTMDCGTAGTAEVLLNNGACDTIFDRKYISLWNRQDSRSAWQVAQESPRMLQFLKQYISARQQKIKKHIIAAQPDILSDLATIIAEYSFGIPNNANGSSNE